MCDGGIRSHEAREGFQKAVRIAMGKSDGTMDGALLTGAIVEPASR
jgi:hypothetical protein